MLWKTTYKRKRGNRCGINRQRRLLSKACSSHARGHTEVSQTGYVPAIRKFLKRKMEWAPTLLLCGGFPSSIPLRGTTAFWFVVDAHGLNLCLGLYQFFLIQYLFIIVYKYIWLNMIKLCSSQF